ncbi:MAG: ADP-ribosylglycohydrolase family protein [Gudongella sp.]|nr:ADP-ribosylglycohydrolase family protein [Gudongella sp.]
MKAWERASNLYKNAKPRILEEEDQTWEILKEVSKFYDQLIGLDWKSNVPGSGAPEMIMVAAVQAMENRGYKVSGSQSLLDEGISAYEGKDFVKLHQISASLRKKLLEATKDEASPYWDYKIYNSFEEYEKNVDFEKETIIDVNSKSFKEKIYAAWLSQLVGAAMGTQIEGYTRINLKEAFGEVNKYLREPNTYNDDITFELAFLEAFIEKGYLVDSTDIALKWVGLVPTGWSAEEFALRNIKMGIFPPKSGSWNNPFNEWIGAQMRGAICGMLAPGNPRMAARLAWVDAEVSHAGNGILGEVFNALMVSMAFENGDIKDILYKSIELIPKDTEYRTVIDFAILSCINHDNWEEALEKCEEKYIKYNWIHAYPNACAEVIALYFGEGNFEKTMQIISRAGIDVDCNAAQILSIIGIQKGIDSIPDRLIHKNFEKIITYMRDYKEMTLEELVEKTVEAVKKAAKKKED